MINLDRKIEYIQDALAKDRYFAVSRQGILLVIENEPFPSKQNPAKLTAEQLYQVQNINRQLMFPINTEVMAEIIKLSKQYDNISQYLESIDKNVVPGNFAELSRKFSNLQFSFK